MMTHHRNRNDSRQTANWFMLPLVVSLLAVASCRCAEPMLTEARPPRPNATAGGVLDLALSIQLARQQQPRIAAQRESLAAALDGQSALERLHFPATLASEVPIRRRQAELGVKAAAAGLDQSERETNYAVKRTYFTVLYAREQERLARGVVERLTTIRNAAQLQLDAGAEGIAATDVGRTLVYLRLAETKRTQATQGVKRALAALREAVGFAPCVTIDVAPGEMLEPNVRPDRNEVIASALAHRGDLMQAMLFSELTCLEIDAQSTSCLQRMQTFAVGSDLHAHQVPQEVHNSEYRPGAVPPEMPTLLVGSRPDRLKTARDFHERADAVVAATRNLIALEAEDAFLRWEEASQQAGQARAAAEAADALAESLTRDFNAQLKVKVDDVINARVLATQAHSQFAEYLYHEILALADLERITAGGFSAGLVEAGVGVGPSKPSAVSN